MKSGILKSFVILTICFLFFGAGFAYTPEGEINVRVIGHETKITFQEIDKNKILVSALDAENNPIEGLMLDDF